MSIALILESEWIRAAVFRGVGVSVTVEQIRLDPPQATELRVPMKAVGLCHTELHALKESSRSA